MNVRRFLAAFCVMTGLLGGLSVSATSHDAIYILSQDGSNFLMEQQDGELTFWEAPNVLNGQSRRDGVITLRNNTDRTVDFVLDHVSLPYDDTAALTYLDAVTLTIKQDDKRLYHDTFTHLMDSERAEIRLESVKPGEERQLSLTVFCDYSYQGNLPSYASLVWTFRPEIKSGAPTTEVSPLPSPTINWPLIIFVVSAVVLAMGGAGVFIWFSRRHGQKHAK